MKFYLLPLLLFLWIGQGFSQGSSCSDATLITTNGNYSGTTAGFTQEFWFIAPTSNGNVTFTISSTNDCGTVVDIAEYAAPQVGDCVPSNSNRIVSNVTASCSGQTSSITLPVIANNLYYIQVAGFFVAEPYTLNVTADVPLPVNLVDQKVSQRDGKAVIEWKTASELNNSYFSIERSRDGRNFREIGRVEGQATINQTTAYQFEDNRPMDRGYYRIVQHDFDGQQETFPLMFLEIESDLTEMKLYNQGGQMVLDYQSASTETYQLQVMNTAGQLVYQENLLMEKGSNRVVLENTGNLPSGVYFAVLRSSDHFSRTSFFKNEQN